MIRQIISFWTEEKSLSAFLVLLVIQIFVISPLAIDRLFLTIIDGFVCSLFFLTGLLAIKPTLLLRWLALSLVVAAVATRWIVLSAPTYCLLVADSILALCILTCFTFFIFRQVFKEGPVSAHRVRGAIAAYLLIGYIFAAAYRLLNYLAPGSLNITPALVQQGQPTSDVFMYFSFITLTTLGFGDVTAVHPVTRSLVMLEGVIGTLYPAILIARLVSLQIEHEKE